VSCSSSARAGRVSIFNGSLGTTNVVADVGGWFTDASNPGATGERFTPLVPNRIASKTVGANTTLTIPVAGQGGVPPVDSLHPPTAVVLNVTATNTVADSFLTVWPSGASRPTISDLNVVQSQTVGNLVVVKLGTKGMLDLFNLNGSTDVVVDVDGWYS
jgi:hypothetical protein